MLRFFTTLIVLFTATFIFAQKPVFQGSPQENTTYPEVEAALYAWEIYQIDAKALDAFAKNAGDESEFVLELGNHYWDVQLQKRNMRSPNAILSTLTEKGVLRSTSPDGTMSYRGKMPNSQGWSVSLTLNEEFIYGYFEEGSVAYFIEPLWYFVPGQPKDLYIVYAASDSKPDDFHKCGVDAMTEKMEELDPKSHKDHNDDLSAKMMACKEIELATAADLSMYNFHGSAAAVNAFIIGVMANVQTNYDNEFNDELQFNIVEQFVVTPPSTDPWTSSNNASTLLNSFTNWGPSGFAATHDLGQLWTKRDMGQTVGIAWVCAVCTNNRYHVVSEFTSNACFLRVMTSHEIGHNFCANHDNQGDPYIMAPSVGCTSNWSSTSISVINNYYPGRPCLGACTSSQPPVAGFSANPTTGCAPVTVQFTDQSTNATTWSWSFPGGTPSSSSQPNPIVLYSVPGSYNVSLTVTNAVGSNTFSQNNYITVLASPVASFSYVKTGLTLVFTNTSTSATSYFWDFGDGNTSTQANPTHTYANDGFYDVTLTATNACGSVPFTTSIPVFVLPSADFSATPTTGCAPLTVGFVDQSSTNTISWNWSFPGGTPSSSTQQFPTVSYQNPGTYNVTLSVSNPAGTDVEVKTAYITVGDKPTANFTFVVNGATVSFTSTSTNPAGSGPLTYAWDFGDGGTSTQANPTYTYTSGGAFGVTLTVTNNCGNSVKVQSVTIPLAPVAGFTSSNPSGCATHTVNFTNTSAGASTYNWSFPGGNPSSSTVQNPTVEYATPGTYNVTLIVGNAIGSDTLTLDSYVTVNTTPNAGFTSNVNGLNASFSNTSTNATSYAWDFGDGGNSTDANPTHAYTSDGVYTVVLSATNACGTVTSTQTVTIVTVPISAFSANTTSGCAPLSVQFNNLSSSNATAWAWSFPGGSPSTSNQQNPTVTYASPGTYSVTLIAANSAGSDTTTLNNYITANAGPTAGFTSSVNSFDVSFTNTSTNATSYAWTFGDGGSSTNANPTHTYSADGTYTVSMTATGPCGTNTFSQDVVISSIPVAGFNAQQTSGCAPLSVQFQDQSSSNTTAWSWSFPGGTPSSSTEENPTVSYAAAGSYDVTLIVSNPTGTDTITQNNFVSVGTGPSAGFASSTMGLTANFTNASNGATSYSWDFGDGESSTDANPSHTYAVDGIYTVVLTATNACGTASFTQTVSAFVVPTAAFGANTTSGCAPLTVQFNNLSSANSSDFEWSFPGGTPSSSTDENPTVVYNTAGVYTVTLTVSNPAGQNTATQTNFIVVNTTPSAGFTGSVNGATVSLNNTTTNATSYSWNFGDGGSSSDANPTHTYAADGVYDVTLIATNECGSTTVNGQFTIVTPPTAGFSAGAASGCAPLNVTFNNESSANATSFEWSFPGGTPASSTEENPAVTYNAVGTYTVTLTVTNAAGSDTYTLPDYVVVSTTPSAGFSTSLNLLTATFTNATTNATSYSWDFGDGNHSTDANPTHTYSADGVYTVTLTATNECGDAVFTDVVVIATASPLSYFTAEPTSGCAPLTVTYNNESSSNSEAFQWSFPGGNPPTSTEANPVVVYNTPGTYDATLTASNGFGSNSFTQTSYIVVNGVPTPSFSTSANFNVVTFSNNSTNATSYEWNFGDGNTSTEANPTHTYVDGGQYEVTLTATNDCGFNSTTIEITVQANGTEEIPGINRFDVFPNPNGGRFTLIMEGAPQAQLELNFTNVLGQVLRSEKVSFSTGSLTKDFLFNDLAAGVYVLQVKSGEKALFKKIVIE